MRSTEVLEEVGAFESKEGDGWDCGMDEDLVRLANCASGDIFLNVGGEARPPVILRKEGNGV